jgi:hypothetical protein
MRDNSFRLHPRGFECKDIVTWCVDKLVHYRRTIPLQSESPVSLPPSVFKKILRFPEPSLVYKGEEARNFLKRKTNGIKILQQYLKYPTSMPKYLSRIQVSYLKYPYK